MAQAIVGAGEALANWWLNKPEVPREDVADWYVGLARAAISAAYRPRQPELGEHLARRVLREQPLEPDDRGVVERCPPAGRPAARRA